MDQIQHRKRLQHAVFSLPKGNVSDLVKEVYRYQLKYNSLYAKFVLLSRGKNYTFENIEDAPFLPIQFFKKHKIITGSFPIQKVYQSSATTGSIRSKHYIQDDEFYHRIALAGFEDAYGPIQDWAIVALLPGYLERSDSSLVSMVQYFMDQSDHPANGFYLTNIELMLETLNPLKKAGQKTLLIGVSYALLELATREIDLHGIMVMETGGMKGMANEMSKELLHQKLKDGLNVDEIHSEYGMTELQSQAYAKEGGLFAGIPSLIPVLTEITDPFCIKKDQGTGILNFIDLANIDSCSFIATEDLAQIHPNGQFELLGRLDHSEIRGCNLLVTDLH